MAESQQDPTKRTDAEHKAAVTAAVEALNAAIHAAHHLARLEVRVTVDEWREMQRADALPVISVRVSRTL